MTQNKMVISMMLPTAVVSVIGTPALWNADFWRPSSGGFHRVKISYLFRISCFGFRIFKKVKRNRHNPRLGLVHVRIYVIS